MIVPMSKVSLIILGNKKRETLKVLQKLGLLHVEIFEGHGENLVKLKEQITLLEGSIFAIGKNKKVEQVNVSVEEALSIAKNIKNFEEEILKITAIYFIHSPFLVLYTYYNTFVFYHISLRRYAFLHIFHK